jgi:uncharacterized protein YfdQ (DUF2303 family)
MSGLDIDTLNRLLAEGTAAAFPPGKLTPGTHGAFMAMVPEGYRAQQVNYRVEGDRPDRRQSAVLVEDVPSFAKYFLKHRELHSEVYASIGTNRRQQITAVINASGGSDDLAGYGDHTVTYDLATHPEWARWVQPSGKWMSQELFAGLIEVGNAQIVTQDEKARELPGYPDAATMFTVAQTLQGTTTIEWKSAHRVQDGQRQSVRVETVNARAGGGKTTLDIPARFRLALRPWLGSGITVQVDAIFRHRTQTDPVQVQYQLLEVDEQLDAAAGALVGQLEDALNLDLPDESPARVSVLRGTP